MVIVLLPPLAKIFHPIMLPSFSARSPNVWFPDPAETAPATAEVTSQPMPCAGQPGYPQATFWPPRSLSQDGWLLQVVEALSGPVAQRCTGDGVQEYAHCSVKFSCEEMMIAPLSCGAMLICT